MRLRAGIAAFLAHVLVVGAAVLAGGCDSGGTAPTGAGDAPSGAKTTLGPTTTVAPPAAPADPETPCGQAPDPGGSPEPVHIATISHEDDGEPRGAVAAIESFVAYCNHLGGIAGRPLVLSVLSAVTPGEQVAAVVEACDGTLALVGSAVRLDTAASQAGVDCGLPDVPASPVSPLHADATNVVAPLPNPVGNFAVGPASTLALAHPDGVERAAILFAPGADELNARRQVEAYERSGWHFDYQARLDPGGADADVHALALEERGIRALVVRADAGVLAATLGTLTAGGPPLDVLEVSEDGYSPEVAAVAAAEGIRVAVEVVPLEDSPASPELERYRAWLGAVHPGTAPDGEGVRAWSAALLFATAASATASDLSRAHLLDTLHLVTSWDGHGLHAPADPGRNLPSDCFVVLRIEDGKFAREYPGSGFDCVPDNRLALIGDYGEGAKPGATAG